MKPQQDARENSDPQDQADLFSLVIYQNNDYVAALLQQLFDIGLPIEEFRDYLNERIRGQANEGTATGTMGAEVKLPMLPVSFKASGGGDLKMGNRDDDRSEDKRTQQFRYTEANYLHNVRQQLRDRSLVHRLTNRESLKGLDAGSFVEFSASFEPNEINSILDLATPELVSAIAKHLHRKSAIKNFDFNSGGHDAREAFAAQMELEAASKAEIAIATTMALRQDFRNETTSEYFGKVVGADPGRPVTAVTICDTEHFAGQDRDRILDGTYRVLGKVTEISDRRQSILSRNKVLSRIKQPALSELERQLKDADKSDQFDTQFKLYLQPPIVKVIPIAIYV